MCSKYDYSHRRKEYSKLILKEIKNKHYIMKTHFKRKAKTILSMVLVTMLFACNSKDEVTVNDVSGTYLGTLTTAGLSSRVSNSDAVTPATVTISNVGHEIEVHCIADNFDVTVMLDTYENGDETMVCYTGTDFENMYGHMPGESHMGDNMQGNNTEWMQHLNDDHEQGDEHYGEFNMQDHSFNFLFKTDNGDFQFQGTKN
jgi:hypothetical protein